MIPNTRGKYAFYFGIGIGILLFLYFSSKEGSEILGVVYCFISILLGYATKLSLFYLASSLEVKVLSLQQLEILCEGQFVSQSNSIQPDEANDLNVAVSKSENIVDTISVSSESENASNTCKFCGSTNIDTEGYCDSCGMKQN